MSEDTSYVEALEPSIVGSDTSPSQQWTCEIKLLGNRVLIHARSTKFSAKRRLIFITGDALTNDSRDAILAH